MTLSAWPAGSNAYGKAQAGDRVRFIKNGSYRNAAWREHGEHGGGTVIEHKQRLAGNSIKRQYRVRCDCKEEVWVMSRSFATT